VSPDGLQQSAKHFWDGLPMRSMLWGLGSVVQVVESLPSKHEVLGSNTNTRKGEREGREKSSPRAGGLFILLLEGSLFLIGCSRVLLIQLIIKLLRKKPQMTPRQRTGPLKKQKDTENTFCTFPRSCFV
jgi:hypothetical protein